MQSRTLDFVFGPNFNWDKNNLFNSLNENMGSPFPPNPGNFLLLDGTPFLLLDGTDLLLL